MSSINSPVPVTVIAAELKPLRGLLCSNESVATFVALLNDASALACTIQRFDHGGEKNAYTLILPPGGQTVPVLRRLVSVVRELGRTHDDVATRFVAHSGVVFPTATGDSNVYVGSAIRSAHGMLRRLPAKITQVATKEFVTFSADLPSSPLRFSAITDSRVTDDLVTLDFESEEALLVSDEEKIHNIAVSDLALGEFLTARLTEDLGPFASILVDAAQNSASAIEMLINELAQEIEDAVARQRFRHDVGTYLDERASNRASQILMHRNER